MSDIKTSTEIIKDLQEEFFKKLEGKTSWGKNEVQKLYIETKNEVLMKYINKIQEGK